MNNVIYIATGNEYINDAINSAENLRKNGWDGEISIHSDTKVESDIFDRNKIISDPNYSVSDKPKAMKKAEGENILYLDVDTYVTRRSTIEELFNLLSRFDIAGTVDTGRNTFSNLEIEDPLLDVPPSFPWINTGVLVFKSNPSVNNLLINWHRIQKKANEKYGNINDQAAFCKALWGSDVKHTVLPPEYNFRLPYPQSIAEEVKIIHGYSNNYSKLEKKVNRRPTNQFRQFTTHDGSKFNNISEVGKVRNKFNNIKYKYKRDGLRDTIIDGLKTIKNEL